MSSVITRLQQKYDNALPYADPRTRNWFLIDSPWYVWYCSAFYLLFVWLGPKFMRNRKPINLRLPMIIYNFGLVLLSSYMFVEIAISTSKANYDYICAPYNENTRQNPKELRVAHVLWWHFLSKIIEFMDTFMMILRKKMNQVTFLHVYHHVAILNTWWWVMVFIPGGIPYFGACFNSFVHIVMYTYYGLAAIPSLRPYLWWKKYITKLQMLQFWSCFIHVALNMYLQCDFPKWGQLLIVWLSLSLLALFANFYISAYRKRSRADTAITNGMPAKKAD